MTIRRSATTFAAVVLALLLPAGPAAAEHLTVRDARGDMVKLEEGSEDPTPAPRVRIGDVVHTTFRHTGRHVVVWTKLAALDRSGRRFRVWVDIQSGARSTWLLGVETTPRDRNGHTLFMNGRGRDIPCAIQHRVDYARDVVRVSVPRRCLDTPRSVRFRLLTEHVRRNVHIGWLDNGLAAPLDDQYWTRWLERG
jgi:hypothetical protein